MGPLKAQSRRENSRPKSRSKDDGPRDVGAVRGKGRGNGVGVNGLVGK